MKREGGQTWLLACALCLCAAVTCFVHAFPTLAFGQLPQQSVPTSDATSETINVDLSAPEHPFPHFWEQMFGSGPGHPELRESYRRDLREVKHATDFKYIRFHAIFHDEVGLYDEDAQGKPVYNFSYVDQIYDGLLENDVRPFVELSFMPRKLAAEPDFSIVLVQAERFPAKDPGTSGTISFPISRAT